jgi:hypothetical protein
LPSFSVTASSLASMLRSQRLKPAIKRSYIAACRVSKESNTPTASGTAM